MRPLLVLLLLLAAPAGAAVITFDQGLGGWVGPVGSGGVGLTREAAGGNPGAHGRVRFNDFGIFVSTTANADFTGDLRSRGAQVVGLDVAVGTIASAGLPLTRDLIVEFRSRALARNGYPWTSVWVRLATLRSGTAWSSYDVSFDPASPTLPPGWGGYGDEDPVSYLPRLPPDLRFSDVMAAVDEVAYSTYVPGEFYTDADFDVRVDNLRLQSAAALPIPTLDVEAGFGLAILLALAAYVALRRQRSGWP